MSKLFRAVTALFVTLALATSAMAQSVGFGDGSLPPNEQSTSGSAASAANLFAFRTGGYATAVVQFTSVGSGNTVSFEGSNDNSTWFLLPGYTTAGASHTGAVSPSTSVANVVPLSFKFFRARVSTYSSGTVTAIVSYKANVANPSVAGAPSVVAGNVASGATDSGNPVKVGGVYNSTLPTLTNGKRGDLQVGTRGALNVQIMGPDSTTTVGTTAVNADGQSVAANGLRVASWPQHFNGSTNDREFTCPSSAVINVAAAATTQLIALASSQIIRVCSFVITGDTAATTATFVYGTGANCATGQVALTGAMRMVDEGGISSTGMNGSLFRSIASNALCLTAATGAVTGFVTYAQY